MTQTQYNSKKIKSKIILTYLIIGILFGACFPVGALLLESIISDIAFDLEGIALMHRENPLIYMIDSAPLFLGLFAMLGGISKAKAELARLKMVAMVEEMQETHHENEQLLQDYKKEHEVNRALNHKILTTTQILYRNSESLTHNMKDLNDSELVIGNTIQNIDSHVEEMEAINKTLLDQFKLYDASIEKMYDSTNEANEEMASHLKIAKDLVEMIGSSQKILAVLSKESKEVEEVVSLIADISSRIKLLALNASIESARAGEAGKGFAVVAGEIKALSEQTDEATDQIAETIRSVTSGIYEIEQRMDTMDAEGSLLNESNTTISNEFESLLSNIKLVRESSQIATDQMGEQNETLISVSKQIHDVALLNSEREEKMHKSEEALSVNEEQIELLNEQTNVV